ncbi:MAG: hypothetical protein HY747_03195 [Elusimicrobia bacterium]|nr:hypothetical protein [Elusimicrobiota bacterium]
MNSPPGWAMALESFSHKNAEKLAGVFKKHGINYLFIGKTGAILYGFPDTTQDIDLFPQKDRGNGKKIVAALKELDFETDTALEKAIIAGKDFIQIRGGPFDLDLIFAPDGIESYQEAKSRSHILGGKYPVAHLADIIRSKKSAGRKRDKETLPRLIDFYNYLTKKGG